MTPPSATRNIKRHPLESCRNHTGATMVIKWIMRPHKVQYTAAGMPAVYEDLSMSAFVQGNLIIMQSEDTNTQGKITQHLEELMGDCNLYGWDKVQAFHGVWLNQMEQRCLLWKDSEAKLKFCWAVKVDFSLFLTQQASSKTVKITPSGDHGASYGQRGSDFIDPLLNRSYCPCKQWKIDIGSEFIGKKPRHYPGNFGLGTD